MLAALLLAPVALAVGLLLPPLPVAQAPRVSAPSHSGRGSPSALAAPRPAEPKRGPSVPSSPRSAKDYRKQQGILRTWVLWDSGPSWCARLSPFTFYLTAAGIVAAFFSVFRSFGYIRLSERLGRTATEPAKAPPRAEVVKNLRNSIALNVIGMGAAVLGMQATVGALVGKVLTTSSVPYYQGVSAGQSHVLALDVFLVQASANTILSHFLGLSSSLELLRSVTISQAEAGPAPRPA
ncbi:unnamed protein product [Alopecurus aequalis]